MVSLTSYICYHFKVAEVSTDATRARPAEIAKDDEETSSKQRESTSGDKTLETTPSLTKQDSGSQSILAPLVQPLGIQPLQVPSVTDLSGTLDRDTIRQPSSQKVVNVTEAKADKTVENEVGTQENVVITLSEQSSAMKDIAPEDSSREPPSTSEEGGLRWEPSKSRLATIFSETSSESGQSVSFHFSLPKQPLRPLMSTTPPPIQPTHHDTPDSQESGSRRSILPDVVLPVVSETPGMSSQGNLFSYWLSATSQPNEVNSTGIVSQVIMVVLRVQRFLFERRLKIRVSFSNKTTTTVTTQTRELKQTLRRRKRERYLKK